MIEKLTTYPRPLPNNPMVVEDVGMDNKSLFDKINELVDAVNELQTKVNKLAPNINFAQPDVKENFTTDPYKWVGKLCRFRHCGDTKWKYGILKDVIYDTSSCLVDIRYKMGGIEFRECEPVKPDDDIIYKGE